MKTPSKTIYLHIGTQKTGSSALQFFFTDNLKRLAEQYDVLYPDPANCRFGVGIKKMHNHTKLAQSLVGYWGVPQEKQYPAEELWDEVRQLVESSSKSRILLSSELFGIRQMASHYEKILKFLSSYEIKIVVYLRRQDNFLTSVYNEQVKAGRTSSIEEFISEFQNEAQYDQLLRDLSKSFGKENLIVRPYEKQQFYKKDICADFLHHVFGIELNDEFEIIKTDPNPHLNHDALEFKRIINSLGKDSPEIRRLLTLYCRKQPEKVVLLSPKQRYKLMAKYAAGNEWIAREFLGNENGQLFLEPIPDPNNTWQPYPGLDLQKSLNICKYLLQNNHLALCEEECDKKLASLMIKAVAEPFVNFRTGTSKNHPSSPQKMQEEKYVTKHTDEEKNRQVIALDCRVKELEHQLFLITSSRSWRLTKPIRWIGRISKSLFNQPYSVF